MYRTSMAMQQCVSRVRPAPWPTIHFASQNFKARNIHAASQPAGTCYLVGAGPGDPDFLTVKAMRLLQKAEVVVYDDLGAQEVLSLAPASAQKIYVGKRGGTSTSSKQQDIDAILVDLCRQGQSVVRLKGGCPSVFSRVHSELAALKAAGIPYELVPGVSTALAGPLLAGIPLTHPEVGTSFVVLTGHDPESIDWPTVSAIPTLVILMGGAALPRIVTALVAQGRPIDTPVLIVKAAGLQQQEQWHGTLSSIVEVTKDIRLSPCIIVIGHVAAQH